MRGAILVPVKTLEVPELDALLVLSSEFCAWGVRYLLTSGIEKSRRKSFIMSPPKAKIMTPRMMITGMKNVIALYGI